MKPLRAILAAVLQALLLILLLWSVGAMAGIIAVGYRSICAC